MNAPVLLLTGAVNVNDAAPTAFVGTEKLDSVGKMRTVNVALMLFDAWVAVAACVAVIVVVPPLTIVTVDPLTVATAGLLLV